MGFPQAAALKSCSNMGPYHRVHPSGANRSNIGPPQAAAPPIITCSCVGSSPQSAARAWVLLLQGLSTGHSLLQATSTWSTMGLYTGCRGTSPPSNWSTSSPPLLTFVSAGLFLSTFSYSSLPAAVPQYFFPFLSLLSPKCSIAHCHSLGQ